MDVGGNPVAEQILRISKNGGGRWLRGRKERDHSFKLAESREMDHRHHTTGKKAGVETRYGYGKGG